MKFKYDTSTDEGKAQVMLEFAKTKKPPLQRFESADLWLKSPMRGWDWIHHDYNYPLEPKLVPWTLETVPKVGVLYKTKADRKDYRIPFAFLEDGLEFVRASEMASWSYLLEECLHSLDGGRTWLPCGNTEQ